MSRSEVLRILIVEDERNHAVVLAELLDRAGYQVLVSNSFEDGKKSLLAGAPDLIIADLHLGSHRGTEFLSLASAFDPPPEVMLISGVGSIDDVVRSMQLGAVHYFTKPLNVSEIRSVVEKAAERIRKRKSGAASLPVRTSEEGDFEGIIGTSPAIRKTFDTIRRIAPTTATVLIQGENGTGKELVARAIHNLSPRSDAPFVALNCGALSEGLLESELFGHERGAFTGANAAREGKFSFANKGTLFLDELGDMPTSLQVKLLRVLEEREVTPVGSNKSHKVDVRLLAATNKDLAQEIKSGRFREDLYYRIKVVSIDLPPLRERREDIPLLVETFIRQFATHHHRTITGIDSDAMALLLAESWPGNVRQLRNVVENMVLMAEGPELTVADLPEEIHRKERPPSTALVTLDEFAGYTL
ncbi:MAG TPA: sigma-54 dependent transcriptional regulator, partial [Planctomycetota bacterium]|nr:sigma-54 dependent transcriptional regulator [Planctomycetota bacterium]